MKLPNGDQAFVDIAKLRDYCLNSAHPRGRHKARVFAAALGLSVSDAHLLQHALLDAARVSEADLGNQDRYGQRYTVDFMMNGPAGPPWCGVHGLSAEMKTTHVSQAVTCFD